MKSKSLPKHAVSVGSYDELREFADAFLRGYLNLLFVLGDPGVGKSRTIRNAVGSNVCWIEGNASPLGIYSAAYEHRDRPIVLDDVDGLYRDRNGIRVLKSLCQTEPVKTLSWQSHSAVLEREEIPRSFSTTSRCVIIANTWKVLNDDVAALNDRGHILHFAPAPLEVHEHVATWFHDPEIFDFVADHLHLIASHSMRTYVLAAELKSAGLDWRSRVLSACLSGTALEVARLKSNSAFASEEDRVRAFVAEGHGCRATYFNHSRKLAPRSPQIRIALNNAAPSRSAPENRKSLQHNK